MLERALHLPSQDLGLNLSFLTSNVTLGKSLTSLNHSFLTCKKKGLDSIISMLNLMIQMTGCMYYTAKDTQ